MSQHNTSKIKISSNGNRRAKEKDLKKMKQIISGNPHNRNQKVEEEDCCFFIVRFQNMLQEKIYIHT